MKFYHDKKHTSLAIYAFLVLAAAMLFYEALQNAGSLFGRFASVIGYLQPVIIGFVIAYLLNPLLRRLDDRLLPRLLQRVRVKATIRRGIAIGLTYLITLICLSLFVAIVIPQLVSSIESLFSNMPYYIKTVTGIYRNLLSRLTEMQILNQGTELEYLSNNFIGRLVVITEGMLEKTGEYMEGMVSVVFLATTKITAGLINVILGIIISIYLLYDREKLFAQVKKITAAVFPDRFCRLLYELAQDSNRIFSGFIIGKVIDSIIIGILCFIVMSILGLPFAVLISVIVGVTNVIPYFGPFIGAIPGALIIFIINPPQALWFLIFIFVLQQFDGNILGPKILGDTTGLSALWVIFAITLFSRLLGVMGMFIGVPLFAILYSWIKKIIAFLLERKGKSTDTRDYDSDKNQLIR